MTANPERHLIKKYANRKLYDTRTSRYITLDEIAQLVRAGDEIKVIDRGNGSDLTQVTHDGQGNDNPCQCNYDLTVGVDPQNASRVYLGFQELSLSTNGATSFLLVALFVSGTGIALTEICFPESRETFKFHETS